MLTKSEMIRHRDSLVLRINNLAKDYSQLRDNLIGEVEEVFHNMISAINTDPLMKHENSELVVHTFSELVVPYTAKNLNEVYLLMKTAPSIKIVEADGIAVLLSNQTCCYSLENTTPVRLEDLC